MNTFKTAIREPRHGVNVFAKHELHHQPFWTRAYLMGEEWNVMTWHGVDKVSKYEIEEWMQIPEINA